MFITNGLITGVIIIEGAITGVIIIEGAITGPTNTSIYG